MVGCGKKKKGNYDVMTFREKPSANFISLVWSQLQETFERWRGEGGGRLRGEGRTENGGGW